MKLVMLESPFAGDTDANLAFARECAKDCLSRGEAPFASHLFYPQFLDDDNLDERKLGIQCGLEWGTRADYYVFYTDRGWSRGMLGALDYCLKDGRFFRIRGLKEAPWPPEINSTNKITITLAMEMDNERPSKL